MWRHQKFSENESNWPSRVGAWLNSNKIDTDLLQFNYLVLVDADTEKGGFERGDTAQIWAQK